MFGMTSATNACCCVGHSADVVLGVQRRRDFLAQERADGLAGDAAHDLAEQEALMVHVIGGLRADLPERRLLLERFDDRFAIERRAGPERIRRKHGHGRGVVEEMPHERLFLAVAAVLGPVPVTRAFGSTSPRSISMLKQMAVMPFATDIMQTVVGASHGTRLARSRQPPQMSTTVRPSSTIEHAAPTSSSTLKFSTNASTTASVLGRVACRRNDTWRRARRSAC